MTAFRDGEVTLRSNRRIDGFTEALQEIGYQGVRTGDLVIHAMDAFAGAIGIAEADGKCSPVYAVCRPTEHLEARYFGRLLRHMALTGFITSLAKGIRERSTDFRWNIASGLFLPLPPLDEQRAIAGFLDRETGKIDAAVEEQRRLIALLKEKRQAVISHAVTRGLDPTAPLKPSGIDWLGDIPAHWEVKQLKRLAAPGTSITYGIVQAGPYFNGGVPYIRTSDMSGTALPTDGYPLTDPEIDEAYSRSRVKPGDLVIAIRATVGKCLPVPDQLKIANLTQGTAKISPGRNVMRDFLLHCINALPSQRYFDSVSKGVTFKEITLDALRRLSIAVPPHEEQATIVSKLKERLFVIDALISEAETAIALLQERRSALISAAVTGKIDVRTAADPSPDTARGEVLEGGGLPLVVSDPHEAAE